jgi:hypothetical protein
VDEAHVNVADSGPVQGFKAQRIFPMEGVASVSVRKGKKPGRLCEGLDFGGSVTGGVQPVEGEVIVWL